MVQNGWGYGHGWREVGWPVEFTLKSYSDGGGGRMGRALGPLQSDPSLLQAGNT